MKAALGILFGLIGLLMSSCGGIFFATTVGSTDGYASGIRTIAGISLVIGVLLLWAGIALWRSSRRQRASTAAPPEST
jgi:hypothetical protein